MAERRYHRGSRDGKLPRKGDPLAGVAPRYDVVVVGSGLGGLTAANVLARGGHRVLLLEQHYNLGGLATWFKRRGGHVFDVSLHGFPEGMRKTLRKYWTAELAAAVEPVDGIRYDNPQFQVATSFTEADFTRLLVEELGQPRAAAKGFFDEVRHMDFFEDDGRTTRALFERWFPGRNDVHRLLLEPISYANGASLDDPAISYGIVFSNFARRGIWTLRGGTDWMIGRMKDELRRNGVELRNNVQVERVLVEGGRVTGVLAEGRELACTAVVSNANLHSTVLRLVGPDAFRPEFVEEVRGVRLNNSSCQVYFGLEAGATIPFVAELFFTSTRPEFDSEALCDLHGQSRTFSFYYPKTRPGSGRHAIVSSSNARFADWASMTDDEYERAKQRLIENDLAALEAHLPGIRARLGHLEAATPRTLAFYTQHPGGSSFGTKFEGLRPSMHLSEEVEGLFHAGSVGIIMSGWLGAANYGVIAANKVDALLRSAAPARA